MGRSKSKKAALRIAVLLCASVLFFTAGFFAFAQDEVTTTAAQEHEHSFAEIITKDATCEQNGEKQIVCEECGYVEESTVIPKLGHSYGSWVTVKQATYTAKGSAKRTCSRCKKVETKELAVLATKSVTKCSFSVSSPVDYTGKAVTPTVTVKDGKTKLTASKHFTVKYSSNKNIGTAKVVITGIKAGGYTGSKTLTFKIALAKPQISATSTTNSITLSWKKVTAATKYAVYSYDLSAKKYKLLATVTSTSYTVKRLSGGKTYTYAVKAYATVNKKSYTSMSPVFYAATKPGQASAPTVSSASSSTIKLSWKKVSGATGYTVYSYNSSTKKYTALASTSSTGVTVSGLKSGTVYKLAVCAYREAGSKKYYAKKSSLISATTAPAKVTSLKATQTDKSVTLQWAKSAGATGYYVYSYNSSDKKYTKIKTVTSNSAVIGSLASNYKYQYAVAAYKTYNKKTYTGTKSELLGVTTKKADYLSKYLKIFRSGTFSVSYSMTDPSVGTLALTTSVKNNSVVTTSSYDGMDLKQIYLADKKKGYIIMEFLLWKYYDEFDEEQAKKEGLDAQTFIDTFAPEMSALSKVTDSIKVIGSKVYNCSSYMTKSGSTVKYYFLAGVLKRIDNTYAGTTEKVEISSVSSSVSDSAFSLPKNFPKGYKKMDS